MIIDDSKATTTRIYFIYSDQTGVVATPDTSIKMSIYPANSDTPVVNGANMTALSTGVYYYAWNTIDHPAGSYTAYVAAVNDSKTYGTTEQITLIKTPSGSSNEGVDKAIQTTARIYATLNDTNGLLADANSFFKVSIYPANSDTPTVNAANMTKLSTGNYYYVWDVTSVAAGCYTAVFTADDATYTYTGKSNVYIFDSTEATPSPTGSVKFFDSNLIESATVATVPALSGAAGQIIENIKDNRSETTITVPVHTWGSNSTGKIDPDGNMDSTTGWSSNGIAVFTVDPTGHVLGTMSLMCTSTSPGEVYIEKTFTSYDMSNNKIGWITMYNTTDTVTEIQMKVTDSHGFNKEVTVTKDYLGNAPVASTTQFYKFDFAGDTSAAYDDIVKVQISWTYTDANTHHFYVDGLRFTQSVYDFIYQFGSAQDVHLIEAKGVDSANVQFHGSADGSTWTLIKNASSLTSDYVLWYSAIAASYTYYRIRISENTQSGGRGPTIADILILDYLDIGSFYDSDYKFFPVLKNLIGENQNMFGGKLINKNAKYFECEIDTGDFIDNQYDIDFIEIMFNRERPFYIWLNGNRTITNEGEAWREENLYLVQDVSDADQSHTSGICDATAKLSGRKIKLVEAAWIEEA